MKNNTRGKKGKNKFKQELVWLYYDIMRKVWSFYHRWILHKGRLGLKEAIFCRHINPYYVLTPRLLQEQIRNISDIEL